jgi:hypothetical protein
MRDQPLYFEKVISRAVNPARMLPALLEKQQHHSNQHRPSHTLLREAPLEPTKKGGKTDSQKHYRTKMCPYGRECRRRFTCTFAHTENELRRPFLRRRTACALYQRGLCSLGSACRDYHGNVDLQRNYRYKEKVCEAFLLGTCEKGAVCIFIHDDTQLRIGDHTDHVGAENEGSGVLNEVSGTEHVEASLPIDEKHNERIESIEEGHIDGA